MPTTSKRPRIASDGLLTRFRRGISDTLVRRLRPGWVRKGISLMFDGYERFGPLPWIPLPDGTRLSVIAPHPDDESIGCGGLMAAWQAAGRTTEVTFLTRGEQGDPRLRDPDLSPADAAIIRDRVMETRRAEAGAALACLGATGVWMDGADGQLHTDAARLAEQLSQHWAKDPADAICVPFPADRHKDHAAAASIVALALEALPDSTPIYCYEVWSPATVNALFDISDVAQTKFDAIAAHVSQVQSTDYVAGARALNTYRAIAGGRSGLAEGYFLTTAREFRQLTARLKV